MAQSIKWDIIIIGSGAGGGTMAHALAPICNKTGKKILILERGDFLPREKENWDPASVFVQNRYHTQEKWLDKEGKPFSPGMNYFVGGNTKVYGAALLRLREKDFGQVQHYGGISPAWPLSYQDFQPYYLQAEKLYAVHGQRGEDPLDPPENSPYFFPPISHEPYIQNMNDRLKNEGLHPFHLPLGLLLNEKNREKSPCIRCDTCDGFPCLVHAKADSHIMCILPALQSENVTLMTNAMATRLIHNGKNIQAVEVQHQGETVQLQADLFICSCGTINSAALMLRSHLGNDLVGRHYMFHNNSVMIAVSTQKNPTHYEKTMAINDFYFGADDSPLPLGHIQLLGNVKKEMLAAEAPIYVPGFALEFVAKHAVGWWLTSEDLPDPNNRVRLSTDGQIILDYTPNNLEAHLRLLKKLEKILSYLGPHSHLFPNHTYLHQEIPIAGCAHQTGTLRFGKDPKTSVLDLNCKLHAIDNLYVVDGSFFPSIGAVNPTLTIIANALRVADILKNDVLV